MPELNKFPTISEIASWAAWFGLLLVVFVVWAGWVSRRMPVPMHQFGLKLTKVIGLGTTIFLPLPFLLTAVIRGQALPEVLLIAVIAAAALAAYTFVALLLMHIGLHLRLLVLMSKRLPDEGEQFLQLKRWLWLHRFLSNLHGKDVLQRLTG